MIILSELFIDCEQQRDERKKDGKQILNEKINVKAVQVELI